MKIYTKTGDTGNTALIGGSRVPKHHIRIESYGTVDELNSYIGLLRFRDRASQHQNILGEIQDRLFTLGSNLASGTAKTNPKIPIITEDDVLLLEKEIDRMTGALPEIRNFILPGGNDTVAFCHIARCVCRRAERSTVKLNENEPVFPLIITYLNRLSDYLFTLGRMISHETNTHETPWRARQ